MNFAKRIAAVLLTLALIVPATAISAIAANNSPQQDPIATTTTQEPTTQATTTQAPQNITSTVPYSHADFTVSGKNLNVKTMYVDDKGTKINKGTDFVITKITKNGKVVKAIKGAGKYVLTIQGIGKYAGTANVNLTVRKGSPKLKVKVAKKTYKATKLKKKKYSYKLKATSKTKKTYKVLGGKYAKKHIKVSKGGKVTVAKGTKKGTYKIRVTSRATTNYKKATKIVKVVVK